MDQLKKIKAVAIAAAILMGAFIGLTLPQNLPPVQSEPQIVYAASEPMAPAIDKTYAFGSGMGSNAQTANKFIVLHDVGTESGAWENAHYFYNNWANSQTYVQFVVGDGGHIYQLGAPGYQAWGAGSYANANAPVQIELAHTSDPATFAKDYAAYVNLARYYARQYGIPLTLDGAGNGIKTHLWITQNYWGDHIDPYGYLARFGVTKAKLAADLANGIGGAPVSTPRTTHATTPAAKPAKAVNVTYALHVMGGYWLDSVTNAGAGTNGFAGIPNARHDYLTVSVDHGSIRYRVHTQASGWLGWVYKSNKHELVNGAAGVTGQPIDGVQVYYTTPNGEAYKQAYYRSQTIQRRGWLPSVRDDSDYAGWYGEPLDRLQLQVGSSNPF